MGSPIETNTKTRAGQEIPAFPVGASADANHEKEELEKLNRLESRLEP
jgi:hypothetical protein